MQGCHGTAVAGLGAAVAMALPAGHSGHEGQLLELSLNVEESLSWLGCVVVAAGML